MSIIKRSRSNFGVVPRKAMEESEMSLKAKGLLAYLLCMPDDWQIYVSQLAKVHKESKNTIAKAINELIDFGYVTREQKRDGHKFAGYDYTVFDVSQKDVSQKDVSQNLRSVNLVTTNKDNTKEDNTKKDTRCESDSAMLQKFLDAYGHRQNIAATQKQWNFLSMLDKEKAIAKAKEWRAYHEAEGTLGTKYQKAPNNWLYERLYNEAPPKPKQEEPTAQDKPKYVYKISGRMKRHSNTALFERDRQVFAEHIEVVKIRP